MSMFERTVLDHGFIRVRNVAGPTRREGLPFDAADVDPANTARMSFDQMDSGRTKEDDLKLLGYLMKNLHTTPFEMIDVWIEMKMPIFVARQFVRHRTVSINEVSARYVQLPAEWYVPKPEHVGIKAASNKQGRTIYTDWVPTAGTTEAEMFCAALDAVCRDSYDAYESAIKAGIPNELARCFLHLNHYTHWIWKQDLHNLMHFLSLRSHSHAQYEAQQYANAIKDVLGYILPESMKLFQTYRQQKES